MATTTKPSAHVSSVSRRVREQFPRLRNLEFGKGGHKDNPYSLVSGDGKEFLVNYLPSDPEYINGKFCRYVEGKEHRQILREIQAFLESLGLFVIYRDNVYVTYDYLEVYRESPELTHLRDLVEQHERKARLAKAEALAKFGEVL